MGIAHSIPKNEKIGLSEPVRERRNRSVSPKRETRKTTSRRKTSPRRVKKRTSPKKRRNNKK